MPSSGDHFDGYTLVRRIGQGGFGEVWLCRSAAMKDWRALKFIPADNGSALDKEYESLVRYRRAAAQLRSPSITPIEHANRCETGLYYVMPLADGDGADSPESPDWHPRTLRTALDTQRKESRWFTSDKVIAIIEPVLVGLQCLTGAGLVHRDIKPDNILFFGGTPCLGDISLMTDDRTHVTRHGTPGYSTPSWYKGGYHDMYGAAATLYTLLTGNEPDRMGRSTYMWPPQGEASLSSEERKEWLRLHAVIRRATEESPAERYPDFTAILKAARAGEASRDSGLERPQKSSSRPMHVARIGIILGLAGCLVTWYFHLGGITAPGLAIACGCYALSSAKKTSIAAILLGILGLCIFAANLGIEALFSYNQILHEQSASGASTRDGALSRSLQPEYERLIAEDQKNTETFRMRTQATLDWADRELAPLRKRVTNLRESTPDAVQAATEIKSLKDDFTRLIKEIPSPRYEILAEAIRQSDRLYRQAKDLPTTAEEKFNFDKNIAPKFAAPPGEESQLQLIDMQWDKVAGYGKSRSALGWLTNSADQDMSTISASFHKMNNDGRYHEAIVLITEVQIAITRLNQEITK